MNLFFFKFTNLTPFPFFLGNGYILRSNENKWKKENEIKEVKFTINTYVFNDMSMCFSFNKSCMNIHRYFFFVCKGFFFFFCSCINNLF